MDSTTEAILEVLRCVISDILTDTSSNKTVNSFPYCPQNNSDVKLHPADSLTPPGTWNKCFKYLGKNIGFLHEVWVHIFY